MLIDSSAMVKTALGFRVKSGWAAAVVLSGPSSSPSVRHARRIDLSDPAVPESRQPFHAVDDAQCDLEPEENRIEKRLQLVRSVTTQSIGKLWADSLTNGWTPVRAGIVTGSLTDPATIRQQHIRAHAMEGHLFRTVVEEALRAYDLSCLVLGEKTAFETASQMIHLTVGNLKRTLANLGRRVEGPWKSEEKLAALAAWVAVSAESSDSVGGRRNQRPP
jgi:hypothetical protein